MTRFASASALALIAMAGPSFADVTPQQVWDDLETYMEGFGYQVEATETMSGEALAVTDITLTVPIPEEDAVMSVTMPDMTYTDAGDGTVNVTMPASGPMTISFSEDGNSTAEGSVTLMMTQNGLNMNVSGSEGDMRYTYSSDSVSLRIDEIKDGDDVVPADVVRGELTMGPLNGTSTVKTADGMRMIAQDMSYGDLTYDFAFQDPEDTESNGMLKGTIRGMVAEGTTEMPEDANFDDPAAIFENGFGVDAVMSHKGGETQFNFQDGSDVVSGQTSSTGGEIGVAMSGEAVTYAVSVTGQAISMMVPDMPFPIDADFAEAGFSLEMPLAKSDTPKPAGLSILLSDFTMADMLWNIFDPGQVLPRDPATIGVNLEAQVTPFVSLLDAEEMETMGMSGEVPGELNSLNLTDFVVSAIGAQIVGEGAFTFDNSDLESFDGLPRPEGQVELEIAGVNGVIDKLIEMGLVQEQDAMGARMMLGMFTVPGSEPDTASSVIEVNEQGHVLANGQRIK